MGCLLPVAKAAVCCADPPQLVAFVEPRKEARQAALRVCPCSFKPGRLSQATIRAHELMEHCRKELMPAYLPKLIVVLDAGPEPMRMSAPAAAPSMLCKQHVTRSNEASAQVCRCFPTAR